MPQSQSFRNLRIGTRGSKLSRVQVEMVRELLLRGGLDSEVVAIKTSGDRFLDCPPADAGGKGLFTKDLEDAPGFARGAVGIEIRDDDLRTPSAAIPLNDHAMSVVLACERAFQSALVGSCLTAIGAFATFADGRLASRGEVLARDESDFVVLERDTLVDSNATGVAESAGRELGLALKSRAARRLAQ
jgi:hydroxymethylbilane synthase